MIVGVITGDIINSRKIENQNEWLSPLKNLLSKYGDSPKNWEIYRGDSFQLKIPNPENALSTAICIRTCVKVIKNLDVRMAIGIGNENYISDRVTESNGTAFIHSGETFEVLKKQRRNLAITTIWPEMDEELNLILDLASVIIGNWTSAASQIILSLLLDDKLSQTDLLTKFIIG